MSDLLNKIKNFFIKGKDSSPNVDTLQSNILSNGIVESPTVSFQLIFKVYKDKLNSSIVKAKSLRLNLNSMYLDDFNLGISKEKEFVKIDNPCGADLPQITGYYFWDKKYVSTGVYFNVALLNDVDFQSADPVIEVYDFAEGYFTILPFEYCSTQVPNPTVYDFLVNIKSATTLLNPIESEESLDYYLYTADLEGKIYLAPLVEITGDYFTLVQLNKQLNKDPTNTMFTRGELASINSLLYEYIDNLQLNFDNFQYFINLKNLTIYDCDYTTIPDEICNLPNLQKVYLDNNSIYNLSIFKDKNISVRANNQEIKKQVSSGTYLPTNYELSLDFLLDGDGNIPNTSNISNEGQRITGADNKEYISWTNLSNESQVTFDFSSSSTLFEFNGTVTVIATT